MAVSTRPSLFDAREPTWLSHRRLLGIAIAALFAAVCVVSLAGDAAAQEVTPEPFIIGGSNAVLGEIPHQVGVFIRVNADGSGFLCGGSIISEDAIVTAGHCVDTPGLDPINVFVFAGSLNRFDQINGQQVRGSEVIVHPDYEGEGAGDYDDDLAVVKLATPLTFNNNVQPIELATTADFVAGDSVRVSGWGQTTDGGSTAAQLQTVMIDLYSDADCNAIRANAGAGPVSGPKEICAGIPGQDACRGDSGGPLTLEGNGERLLLGIVSHGLIPCATVAPGVYTDVAHYRDWIIDEADLVTLGTQITNPPSQTSLACGDVTLEWIDNADEFWVYAGRSVGDKDYFDSLSLGGSTTSTVMTGLPNDGSTVHVRLWHRETGGSWSTVDVTYTACSSLSAAIVSPSPSSTLDCGVVTMTWTGTADEYWVFAGPSVGSSSHFNSGSVGGNSVQVVGLPGDGSTIHVRFFYRATAGQWAEIDTTYTACTSMASITAPTPGTTLPCTEAPMTWTGDADEYWVYSGPAEGSNEYFNSGSITGLNTTIKRLPADGSTVHVRLFFRPAGAEWESIDATYTACTRMASVSAPAANSEVCGSVALSWSGDADEYWIYAGSSQGASDYLDSDSLGSATSLTVSNLPQDGSTIHIRLWFRATAGEWTWTDISYIAC